jgi:kynureninase
MRPVLTGWYSEFGELDRTSPRGGVQYGRGGARFAGATYDPTSHYRAAAVFDFHARLGLEPDFLRAVSLHQVDLLQRAVEALDFPPAVAQVVDVPAARRAGFLAVRAPAAATISAALRERGVLTDSRGDILRLGPAPYLTDHQLRDAVARLGDTIVALGG